MTQLKAMGFNQHDIYIALRATKNDLEAACVWLLGDRGSVVRLPLLFCHKIRGGPLTTCRL